MADTPRPAVQLEWRHDYDFQHLMARRVENIILVSSTYDTFILQEDGQLNEVLLDEFLDLNLHHTTGLRHVATGAEALALAAADSRFNLIVTAVNIGDMDAAQLAAKVKEAGLDIPVILLAYDGGELADFMAHHDTSALERIFLWQGDTRILLAITKYVEDKLNVAYDTGVAGVQVILLIEDNIRYYSSFLPTMYTEIINHSQSLISEGVNVAHRILRMRARPKILLCNSFEEAWAQFSLYKENVLGVISDIEFPREGRLDPQAGAEFARSVRSAYRDIPVLLQSSRPDSEAVARDVGADFLLKGSPTLLEDLRAFMLANFGFGDFVFRLPDGRTVGRASTLKELLQALHTVPIESIAYHAERNEFSRWLKARTEFHLAHHLRPRRASDYADPEDRRRFLIAEIDAYRREQTRGSVSDFDPDSFDPQNSFARIGEGSLGGKARALAFARHLLRDFGVNDQFEGMQVTVPPCLVLTTDIFDHFVDENDLRHFAMTTEDDAEIERRFAAAPLPPTVESRLAAYLEKVGYPLAVRSSSLLEDSQYQPLAGVYQTYMLPNNDPDPVVRLSQLTVAVKRVYASTFLTYAKNYFKVTPYRLEEEKMAVIIQRMVGSAHGEGAGRASGAEPGAGTGPGAAAPAADAGREGRFYPSFAGVLRSHNFYPTGPLAPEDGVVAMALGLGRTVVDGGRAVAFSPKYPRHIQHFSTARDILANAQREFVAVDMTPDGGDGTAAEKHYPLSVAETDGTLTWVASTYDRENDAVYDGLSRPGVRLVTFAPLLKSKALPLPAVFERLMELGRWGMNTEVEIEFAVELAPAAVSPTAGKPTEFAFLQMRPMALARESVELDIEDVDPARVLVRSGSVLGNGLFDQLRDVLVVDPDRFDRAKTAEIAAQVARLNAELVAEGSPYILVGLGRWGSADPWLGIPVTWEQIAGARVIVESGLKDIAVTPSQGSHFFQNLTSFRVGYFSVGPEGSTRGDGRQGSIDWDWLTAAPAVKDAGYVRHLRFERPLLVMIDGRHQRGVMLKPQAGST